VVRGVLTGNVGYATKIFIGLILLIRVSNRGAKVKSKIWLLVHWIIIMRSSLDLQKLMLRVGMNGKQWCAPTDQMRDDIMHHTL
jgi:hypothetical protein